MRLGPLHFSFTASLSERHIPSVICRPWGFPPQNMFWRCSLCEELWLKSQLEHARTNIHELDNSVVRRASVLGSTAVSAAGLYRLTTTFAPCATMAERVNTWALDPRFMSRNPDRIRIEHGATQAAEVRTLKSKGEVRILWNAKNTVKCKGDRWQQMRFLFFFLSPIYQNSGSYIEVLWRSKLDVKMTLKKDVIWRYILYLVGTLLGRPTWTLKIRC